MHNTNNNVDYIGSSGVRLLESIHSLPGDIFEYSVWVNITGISDYGEYVCEMANVVGTLQINYTVKQDGNDCIQISYDKAH